MLRFANVYGPRSSHKGSVVAKFIKDAMHTGTLTIYGDGEQTRDFIYVEDLCRAIIAALRSDFAGETFQIATGKETRIIDLAHLVQQAFEEQEVSIVHIEQRAGEIIKNYSCVEKARQVLGWTSRIDVDNGLGVTVTSMQSMVAGNQA